MRRLPTDELATLVSKVTEPFLSLSFVPSSGRLATMDRTWKTAALPIDGASPITVAVSADAPSALALSAAMLTMPADEIDEAMVHDALKELVNMTAGLVRSALGLEQDLGLPFIRGHAPGEGGSIDWACHHLRATGEHNLVLSIAHRLA